MKTLIVVNGGDAPGINTCIAHFVGLAQQANHIAIGANGGFAGVIAQDFLSFSTRLLDQVSDQGGTILASSREATLASPHNQEHLQQIIQNQGIDNIVLFGGNGSLHHIPPILQHCGIPYIGIPTTIDNDVTGTERTLGFDSACNFAYQAADAIRATARALPGRIFLLETLGGDCGNLALEIAVGSRAHAVLLPEYDYDDDWLGQRILSSIDRDGYAFVVVCEGVRSIPTLPETINRLTNIRIRYTRLGHAQRAGKPSHIDRKLAVDFAQNAYEHLVLNETGILQVRGNRLHLGHPPIDYSTKPPDIHLYHRVNGLAL